MKPCLSVAHFFRLRMYIQICYKILKRQLLCNGVIHSTEVILHSYKPNYFINQRVIIITKKLSDPILP